MERGRLPELILNCKLKNKIPLGRSQKKGWCSRISAVSNQLIREWEGDEHVTRMDAERSVKISRDNVPAGKDL